jgi:two-component system, sensor histidine kinase PdtaS
MKRLLFPVIQLCMLAQVAAQDGSKLSGIKEKINGDSLLTISQLILKAKEVGKKDTSAADKIFRKAVAKAIKAGDDYNTGKAYAEMGEMYFLHKNHNRSFGAFFKAKEYFVKSGSQKEIAVTNFKLGRQQYYRGNYKISSGHLSYAMQLAKQLKLKSLESDILEYMGILYHVMPVPEYQSSNLLKKSLEIKQQLKDQNGKLHILEKLAGVYYDQKKFDSSLYYNDASVALAEKLNLLYDANLSRLDQIPSLLRLGKYTEANEKLFYVKTNKFDSADLNISIRYYTQAGNYYVALKDTAVAAKKYDTALHIAQLSGFPELSALVYRHMAGAYYYNNNFKKAYEYQLEYGNKMAGLYSYENFVPFKELEYILKANSTEDEVKYLSVQNEIKEVRLKNEKTLRSVLLLSAGGFLLSAGVIFFLYRKQKRKSDIIEKQDAYLQTLMKEIHHRVKNNLQVISSLLDLQSHTIGHKQASEAIRESRNRVQAMALIHQNLYREGDNMKSIKMEDYINSLVLSLFSSYNVKKNKIGLKTKIDPVSADAEPVILMGLVLNELISNALKYAFCNKETGTLSITLKQNENSDHFLLEVKDDGAGFPPGFNIYRSESFGYKLVKAFAHKLKARLEVFNDNGACVQLYIRKFKIAS